MTQCDDLKLVAARGLAATMGETVKSRRLGQTIASAKSCSPLVTEPKFGHSVRRYSDRYDMVVEIHF